MTKTCLTYFVETFPQEKKIIIRQLVSVRDLTYVKPANGWYEDSWKEEKRREMKKGVNKGGGILCFSSFIAITYSSFKF